MFQNVTRFILSREKVFNRNELFKILFSDIEFTSLIVRLNTKGEQTSQLAFGVNSKDEDLSDIGGEYSPYTLFLHPEKTKDLVDLHDTGYFYNSFRTNYINDADPAIMITADSIKEGGVDLITRWGKDIIGLSEDNIDILRGYAISKLQTIILIEITK